MKHKTWDQVNEAHIVPDFKEKWFNKKKIKIFPIRVEIIQEIEAQINQVFKTRQIRVVFQIRICSLIKKTNKI
jgi:hypothetical protein